MRSHTDNTLLMSLVLYYTDMPCFFYHPLAPLVHLKVYDGSRPWWAEADATQPVNAYGRSKLEAEQHLSAAYPAKHVVLRASLIYGPEPPLQAVGRPLFVQFVESQLAQGLDTSFFVDELR